ncbi:MAG: tol-pal system protein YbgF [Desulfovibrio sp.]|jgi:tol-pal system protein YbgF|nr:tol-pal system protein YbgF [Desulfovibrio sp.]
MNKIFLIAGVLLLAGCASTGHMQKLEAAGKSNSDTLRQAEQRLRNLENSVATLDTQVASLNNRVYEVRTRGGQKTGMTVVPIVAPKAVASRPPESPTAQTANATTTSVPPPAPSGKLIDPAVQPSPFPPGKSPARAGKTGSNTPAPSPRAGTPVTAADRTPETDTAPSGMLALPSTEAPTTPVAALPPSSTPASPLSTDVRPGDSSTPIAPTGTPNESGVARVPALPSSSLALPPEHPDLPPMPPSATAAAPVLPPAAPTATAAPSVPASRPATDSGQSKAVGEDAAYKAALQPAMAGRPAEGISRFQEFLQQYPNGRYAPNADYWIGECLYAQGKYREALDYFQRVNANYPKHHKNADALLKAGMTMNRLGDKEGARQMYRTLLAAFPNSEAAGRVRGRNLAQ